MKRYNPVMASSTLRASSHEPACKQFTQLRAKKLQPSAHDALQCAYESGATEETLLPRYLLVASLQLLHLQFRQTAG